MEHSKVKTKLMREQQVFLHGALSGYRFKIVLNLRKNSIANTCNTVFKYKLIPD